MTGKTQNPAYAGMSTEELKRFKYWELRTIAMCIFGYALFYFVRKNFSLSPAAIIKALDLRRPIYKQTAAYGHMGRTDIDLPWERTDKAASLKEQAGL